jgi:hypothetical protein
MPSQRIDSSRSLEELSRVKFIAARDAVVWARVSGEETRELERIAFKSAAHAHSCVEAWQFLQEYAATYLRDSKLSDAADQEDALRHLSTVSSFLPVGESVSLDRVEEIASDYKQREGVLGNVLFQLRIDEVMVIKYRIEGRKGSAIALAASGFRRAYDSLIDGRDSTTGSELDRAVREGLVKLSNEFEYGIISAIDAGASKSEVEPLFNDFHLWRYTEVLGALLKAGFVEFDLDEWNRRIQSGEPLEAPYRPVP